MSSYLNELCRFYARLAAAPDSGMPPEGMTVEQISFALVIGKDGALARVEDLRDSKGRPVRRFVPAAVKRTSGIAANFLWDNTGYALGVDGKGNAARAAKTFAAFRSLHGTLLADCESIHAKALLAFLDKWDPRHFAALELRDALLGSNVVFRLDGDAGFLHEADAMEELWLDAVNGREGETAESVCLVTGRPGPIALVHPAIKGVAGAQSSGAALVSFNCPSFTSYGKEQSANAPVSAGAARAYTSALNHLLRREHRQSVRIGDTSIVFWTDRASPMETVPCRFFDLTPPADGTADAGEGAVQDADQIERLKGILRAVREGSPLNEADRELDAGARFYVLGLAPNAARLSVRFWLTATLEVLLRHVGRWYGDLAIERQFPDSEPEFPPLWQLLRTLAARGKTENVPPELGGGLARCLLAGSRFPENVFFALIQRIHADKQVNYFRAALVKAYLCRNHEEGHAMETMNEAERNIGYRLGRAFALLEKTQKDALGTVNAPLRELYIGAASATPRLVFPVLLRLTQHHVTKARKIRNDAYETVFSKRMGAILGDLADFPAVLSLADQGRFMLGYYHQMNVLYQKKTDAAEAGE